MSCTELYFFDVDGKAQQFAEIRNAFRGAMAIWNSMEEKYLPPYEPEWAKGFPDIKPTRAGSMPSFNGEPSPIQEIWDLPKREDIPILDKLVLISTWDYVVVKKENLHILLDAFKQYSGETSVMEQVEAIETLLKSDEEFQAIGWNQTSVNSDTWLVYDSEEEESHPYNITIQSDHFYMFGDWSDYREYEMDELRELGYVS